MARQTASRRRGKPGRFHHNGEPSVFTCPDCQGTLFLIHQETILRLQCRVGHAYSPESMLESQDENVERLMWSATRALEEQSEYMSQMSNQLADAKDSAVARDYFRRAASARQKANAIRKLITDDRKPARH